MLHIWMKHITHTSMYMYICMYVCMYACTYVCTYVCMHVYMYVCMYVCMHEYACIHSDLRTQIYPSTRPPSWFTRTPGPQVSFDKNEHLLIHHQYIYLFMTVLSHCGTSSMTLCFSPFSYKHLRDLESSRIYANRSHTKDTWLLFEPIQALIIIRLHAILQAVQQHLCWGIFHAVLIDDGLA